MICARCGVDSRKKDRSGGRCPKCGGQFAFMQGSADPVSDKTFARAIETVSGRGQVRWGVEHLYYEVSRRTKLTRRRAFGLSLVAIPVLLGMSMVVGARSGVVFFVLFIAALCFIILCGAMFYKRRAWNMPKTQFESLWNRWCTVHGTPKGLIVRRQEIGQTAPRTADPDLALYSFDRAVICDRARTVDLLLANNFHFENNCAVLSVNGYPGAAFATVLAMLRRNPRLKIFALHDCTAEGCALARTLASDPKWFRGQRVIDVGLRPAQARNLPNLIAATGVAPAILGVTREEMAWLSEYSAELAVLRPAQVLRRLFQAMNKAPEDEDDLDFDAGGERRERAVSNDDASFSSDGTLSDGGADAFG